MPRVRLRRLPSDPPPVPPPEQQLGPARQPRPEQPPVCLRLPPWDSPRPPRPVLLQVPPQQPPQAHLRRRAPDPPSGRLPRLPSEPARRQRSARPPGPLLLPLPASLCSWALGAPSARLRRRPWAPVPPRRLELRAARPPPRRSGSPPLLRPDHPPDPLLLRPWGPAWQRLSGPLRVQPPSLPRVSLRPQQPVRRLARLRPPP